MLEIHGLVKSFDGQTSASNGGDTKSAAPRVRAVDDIEFTVEEGELFTLLGPSGCGKTTTLRSIAGLETPDEGRISLRSRVLFDGGQGVRVPANQRRLGMVFQSYAIWPHMTVFENVVFPLRALPRKDRPTRKVMGDEVERVLALVHLEGLGSRGATNLSGGQQQRLALARALIVRPEVLLLDEPLSNLDAKLRESLRLELTRLQQETGQTTVYVTHDQSEALALSSRIAVMRDGKVAQIGTPQEVYERPGTEFVARFIGTSNFVDASVVGVDGDTLTVSSELGQFRLETEDRPARRSRVGDQVTVSIRPETVQLSDHPAASDPTELVGTVRARAYSGDAIDYVVDLNGIELRVKTNPSTSLNIGATVKVTVSPGALRPIPKDELVGVGAEG